MPSMVLVATVHWGLMQLEKLKIGERMSQIKWFSEGPDGIPLRN